jgi:hypothetical protein
MEIILAIVVAFAVIFFGALVSIGNERQRKAIDKIREQMSSWAIRDLQIKRGTLALDIQMDDSILWLNKTIANVFGRNFDLYVAEKFFEPHAILCESKSLETKIICSPLSPTDVRRFIYAKKGKFDKLSSHPFSQLPKKFEVYEISILNGGTFFDIELQLAWKDITGYNNENLQKLWIYFSPTR